MAGFFCLLVHPLGDGVSARSALLPALLSDLVAASKNDVAVSGVDSNGRLMIFSRWRRSMNFAATALLGAALSLMFLASSSLASSLVVRYFDGGLGKWEIKPMGSTPTNKISPARTVQTNARKGKGRNAVWISYSVSSNPGERSETTKSETRLLRGTGFGPNGGRLAGQLPQECSRGQSDTSAQRYFRALEGVFTCAWLRMLLRQSFGICGTLCSCRRSTWS